MKIVWTANALQDADKAFQYAADNFGPIQVKESEEVCLIDAIWDTRQDPSKLRRRFK